MIDVEKPCQYCNRSSLTVLKEQLADVTKWYDAQQAKIDAIPDIKVSRAARVDWEEHRKLEMYKTWKIVLSNTIRLLDGRSWCCL